MRGIKENSNYTPINDKLQFNESNYHLSYYRIYKVQEIQFRHTQHDDTVIPSPYQ
jgi:hypothetical protein